NYAGRAELDSSRRRALIERRRILAKRRRDGDRFLEILGLAAPRARAGLEGVVAVGDPVNANRRGQSIRGDLLRRAKGIAGALHDQGGCSQCLEVLCSESVGLAGRMKRVTETEEPTGTDFIGDEACDSPAQRLASDGERRTSAELLDDR